MTISPARTAVLTLAVVSSSYGCGQDHGGEWVGTITEVDGVVVVANTNEGLWGDGEAWTVQEELRIGTVAGDDAYQFGQVGTIAVTGDGSIHVIDVLTSSVKSYSAEGVHLRTFGRPGSGPGEIGAGAVSILTGVGDTLVVPDLGNQRINLYTVDGQPAGSTPIRLEAGLPMIWRATSDGTILRQSRPASQMGLTPGVDSMDLILASSPAQTPPDTLMSFRSGGTLNLTGATPNIEMFATEPVWAVRDDRSVLYGTTDDYRIEVHRDGEVVGAFTKPFTPKPVTEADRDAVLNGLMDAFRDQGVPPEAMPVLRGLIRFGETFPAFAYLQLGPEGTIWVQHSQSVEGLTAEEQANFNLMEQAGASDWDVFDAEGRFLGVVTMPERFSPRTFAGNDIYGVSTDELGVQYVVRMRVVGPEI